MAYRNLVGEVFGQLEVLSEAEPYISGSTTARRWLCRCACGKEVVKWGTNLTTGQSSSCGCVKTWGTGKERGARRRYQDYQHGAEKRGLAFELTLEAFDTITQEPCAYCGQKRGAQRGVDRIDSELGYVEGNVAPCCWLCNRGKGADLTPEAFNDWVRSVYEHSIKSLTTS